MMTTKKYMNKVWLHLFTFLAFHLFILSPLPSSAQDSLLLRDYQFVKQQDKWLTHDNAAALTRFSAKNIVEAEASLTKGNGGLVNYNDSRNTIDVNVGIESFYRLSKTVVGYGAISYNNWTGRDMTGTAFYASCSTLLPFDLVEDSLTNPGKKHSDTYHLAGAIGVDVYHGISLGARLDYTAANYAKYKDLRHKNKFMDLQLSMGAYIPVTSWLKVGADYKYQRQSESLSFGTYGKSEKVYKTLIDYGAFMGMVEQFGNEGYTDKSREMPLIENRHGASVQIAVDGSLSLFASFGFMHGDGYYGRRSPYTITYTNHERDSYGFQSQLSYAMRVSRHLLDFSFYSEKLNNNANTFREMNNESGAAYYEYYDPVETGKKKLNVLSLLYRAQLHIHGELPTWEFAVGYDWTKRQQTAYLYPYFRYQQLIVNRYSAEAVHNLVCRKGVWSFTLNAAYQKGSGNPCQDGSFIPTDNLQQPATMEAFLYREYQYLTALQFTIGGSVKYAFVFPATRLKTYAKVAADYRKANNLNDNINANLIGNDHVQIALTLGCDF